MLIITRKRKWLYGLLMTLPLLLAIMLISQTASHDGEWRSEHTRLPVVHINGGHYHIENIRDFRYHPDGEIETVRYLEQSFSMASLQRVWLGISHFSQYGVAHTFLSFEFADGHYLVASIEARLRPEQRYHPVNGLLRQYHKIIVLGTEADLVGLRSHLRGERVLLYPLQFTPQQRQHIFAGVMDEVRELQQRPAFYHTLLDNCTTNLLRHDPGYRPWHGLLDYRILLPGHADSYALDRGWLSNEHELPQLRRLATIPPDIAPEQSDFSTLIRQPPAQWLSLSLLVMQQHLHAGIRVTTQGLVRGFDDPLHYWIEDVRLNRVALEPEDWVAPYLGQRVEVTGRFDYHPEEGRRMVLESIQPLE